MPVAAVPSYLGQDFKQASPGMRFGMYLPIWATRKDQERRVDKMASGRSPQARELRAVRDREGMDAAIAVMRARQRSFPGLWEKDDDGVRRIWRDVCRLERPDRERMEALTARQQALAAAVAEGAVLRIDARAVAPFTTGLGNEHPLENGFAFLWPYGLPYLAGSGVKGVVRQAARELTRRLWGEEFRGGWDEEQRYVVRDEEGRVLVKDLTMLDVLFGKETEGGETEHFRGVLAFWDVIPQIEGGSLRVEIMTPHQKHYYQEAQPPHDCGDPTPISFLTVPPGSRFSFHVVCDEARLERVAPDLLERDGEGVPRWRALLEAAFGHAFSWLGFGAKTAVGYGHMERDREEEERRRRELEAEQARLRREAEEAERRRCEEEEERRRREAFEQLPESEKALHRFRDALAAFEGAERLDEDRFARLAGLVNDLAEQAQQWSTEERARVADAIEEAFDRFGWAPSGLRAERRRRQEKKRRDMVAKLRGT